ncbi:MAG: MATE family efflux transporter [Gammaproteobacteria bacterium]|nr:MATE family efflux transporter [Gammaproteobacteria bacterium]
MKEIIEVEKADENFSKPSAQELSDFDISEPELVDSEQLPSDRDTFNEVILHTLPLIAAGTIAVVASFGNAVIITEVSDEIVNANAYVGSIKNLLIYPARAIFFALQPLIGTAHQNEDTQTIRKYWQYSLLLALELSLVLCIPLLNIEPILNFSHQNKILSAITGNYFRYFAAAVPAYMLTEITNELFVTTNNQQLLIPSSILRTTLELGSNYLFIHVLHMGANGWALAALLHPILSACIILLYIALSEKFKHLELFKINANGSTIQSLVEIYAVQKRIMQLGVPIGLQSLVGFGAVFSEILMLGEMDVNGMVAFNVSNQWSNWILNIHTSLSTTASVLTSQRRSRSSPSNPENIGKIANYTSVVISVAALIVMSLAYKPMTSILLNSNNNKEKIMSYTKVLMPLIGVSTLGFGLKYITTGALRGYEETKTPMIADIAGTVAGLGLSATLGFAAKAGPIGVGVGDAVGLMCAALLLLYVFAKKTSKNNKYPTMFSKNPLSFQLVPESENLESKLELAPPPQAY